MDYSVIIVIQHQLGTHFGSFLSLLFLEKALEKISGLRNRFGPMLGQVSESKNEKKKERKNDDKNWRFKNYLLISGHFNDGNARFQSKVHPSLRNLIQWMKLSGRWTDNSKIQRRRHLCVCLHFRVPFSLWNWEIDPRIGKIWNWCPQHHCESTHFPWERLTFLSFLFPISFLSFLSLSSFSSTLKTKVKQANDDEPM